MTIYCPNYRCHLQQNTAKLCTNCGTPLDIHGIINGQAITYQLTKVLRDSAGKINDDGYYCWYELFQAQANDDSFVIKMLIIVPDRLTPASDKHINKVKIRFQREYDLLCKGLAGVCKGYEILDIPVGIEVVRAIVMEEISGLNLEEYLAQNNTIDSQRALRWIKQLLMTISNMHKNQVQHRDIKPSNIMVTGRSPNEQLILIDFGIALDRSRLTDDTARTDVMGTSGYLDPVYRDSGKYLNNSDFYSLGQTFINLLIGELPEDKNNWDKDHHIAHPPINLKLRNTIRKMIILDKTKRFQTAEQISRHLEGNYLPKWLKLLALAILGLIGSFLMYIIFKPQTKLDVVTQRDVFVHPICAVKGINCGNSSSIGTGNNVAFELISSSDKKEQKKGLNKYEEIWMSAMKSKRSEGEDEEKDGESLIYLNNAKIQVDSPTAEIFTLLTSVPPYNKPSHVSEHILRGISQAQKDFNDKNTSVKLYIAILEEPGENKGNRADLKRIIVEALKKSEEAKFNNKFIGAIGHYSSQITFDVLELYAENKMLLLSPSAASTDMPNKKTTFGFNILEYFARVVPSRRAYEVLNLLRQLANNKNNCDLLNVHLIYQTDDVYSNSLGSELKSLFYLTNTSDIRNVLIDIKEYQVGSKNVDNLKNEIMSYLKDKLKTNDTSTIKTCKPKQIIVFFPGPYTTTNQVKIIRAMVKEVPKEASFVGNMTLDILSDPKIQEQINDPDLYSRTFIISPFDILDFLPSYFSPQKSTQYRKDDLIKNMVENTKDGDISDVNWRQISSADSVRTFIEAINRYQKINKKSTSEKESRQMIRDIIKSKDFLASGVFDKIEFNDYERKDLKGITLLKYIRHEKNKNMVTVPVGYRDPQQPDKEAQNYRPLHIDALKLEN